MMIWKNQVVEETALLEEIQRNGTKEQQVIKKLKKGDGQSWEKDEIVYVNRRIYVPNNQKIKERILQENHKPADIEYQGQHWVMELIKRNYWWPEIKNNMKNYVQGCFKWQQNKIQHMKKARELHPLKTPEEL